MEHCLKDAQANVRKIGEVKGSIPSIPWTGVSSMKPTSDTRRNNKPLMEKRRRARINQSVALLKNILLANRQDVVSDKPQKQAKLEKADILEMTVRHFQMTRAFDKKDVDHYRCGFSDCVREVERFFNTPDVHTRILPELADLDIKIKLLRHLENCTSEIESKKTSSDEPSQLIDNPERNIYGLKTSDVNSLNAFQEQMTKELVRNMVSQKQSEKENLFMGSDQSEIVFNTHLDSDIVKQEALETILSQEGLSHDAEISENDQKTSEDGFKVNTMDNDSMLSMVPSVAMPGQVVFLVPANVFGINNIGGTSHFLAPFLSKVPEDQKTTTRAGKIAKKVKIAERNNDIDINQTEREVSRYELCELPDINNKEYGSIRDSEIIENDTANHDMGENELDEPLDFSMHSDMTQNDPMWRPW